MKKLLNTCYIIWVIYFVGKDIFPLVFRNFYVFWGLKGKTLIFPLGFSAFLWRWSI